ncbi:hypothetical protein QTP70_011686 [Hemibagrus guttatus]|uniref:Ig-like domain-containing protein n=1 Tax=Hemibagrus guttatus TaxID=175788 RepID=A0AAE0QM65_9TELE|nr:hypothetical protein QTP70_011686 [Hemibagrus guttatus]
MAIFVNLGLDRSATTTQHEVLHGDRIAFFPTAKADEKGEDLCLELKQRCKSQEPELGTAGAVSPALPICGVEKTQSTGKPQLPGTMQEVKTREQACDRSNGCHIYLNVEGVISLSLLQIISADLLSVDPGQNITLLCNITNYSEISWYHMNSAGVRKLISARRGKLDKHFYIDYNEDESHFYLTQSSSSVSLVIIGVRETDLGFYYCGGRNKQHIQFGKPKRLNFRGKSTLSTSSCCSCTTNSTEQNENIHYASVQYKRKVRGPVKNNTTSNLDSVTYATVASQPQRH